MASGTMEHPLFSPVPSLPTPAMAGEGLWRQQPCGPPSSAPRGSRGPGSSSVSQAL